MFEWIGQNLPLFLVLVGTALMIAEAFAPGAHFIVIGVTLLVSGLVGLLLPAGIFTPAVLAGLVLGVGAITAYIYQEFDLYGGEESGRTSDSDSLRGQTGRITERVTAAGGEVKLDDGGFNPYYRAESVDGEIDEGTEVMVVDPGGGNVVTVEPISADVDEIDRALARGRERDAADSDTAGDETPDARGVDDADREFETDAA